MTTNSPRPSAGVVRGRFDRLAREERGAVAVLAALLIVVLMAAVAFTIDLGRLYHERQSLQNAVDFGALAGAHELPTADGVTADLAAQTAVRVTVDNHPELDPRTVETAFQCVVGDRNGDGQPDDVDIGAICGRRGDSAWATGWRIKAGKAWHACNPYAGDMCNTIVVSTRRSIPYYFAPVIGINTGSTGVVSGASCRGACGGVGTPLDVVMVIDRSSSMTPTDLANVKNAATAVLELYDPESQYVGLVGLPYADQSNRCNVNSTQVYPTSGSRWDLVGLSSDYRLQDGSLNNGSQIVSTIACLQRPPNGMQVTPPNSGHTDLGDPMEEAMNMLLSQGRPDVPDAIIFMTDGEANQPNGLQPCGYAFNKASLAKSRDVEVFTIAYGVANARCTNDTSGGYSNAYASTLLANMATDSNDNAPGGCVASENTDLDNYFCESGSGDLEPAFKQAAAQAIGNSHLLDF